MLPRLTVATLAATLFLTSACSGTSGITAPESAGATLSTSQEVAADNGETGAPEDAPAERGNGGMFGNGN